ncbi:hypothetical protein [Haladaptatus salinisoli]|uniref:hypothetical protein n=1 Tax=Haladaptatus salinisoli TaxID=2884876 RepID=UPI001D0B7EA2|nr:hypothetical protein [Haladaptatus salinisoli]
MLEEKTAGGQSPRAQQGIPQRDLFTAIEIFADLDRAMAEKLVEQQRRDGAVVIYAYQNPEDIVRLPETTE